MQIGRLVTNWQQPIRKSSYETILVLTAKHTVYREFLQIFKLAYQWDKTSYTKKQIIKYINQAIGTSNGDTMNHYIYI